MMKRLNVNGDTTVVLVHAAWFDGSSWNKVTADLARRGHRVVSAQIPLTSFADDVEALRRLMRRQPGPVVLAGHSYGGAVITAAGAGDDNVKALVYVAAIVPDEGETVGDVFSRAAPHPKAPMLHPGADGFLWLDAEAFRNAVAPDASEDETTLMAASQKPIHLKCLSEPMGRPAWREKASWFLIAEHDRMVSPETQRFLTQRMQSTVVSLPVDHVPLLSRPGPVVELLEAALAGVAS
jgi:pimeloyl-ACP methyl ester carboxylesterase